MTPTRPFSVTRQRKIPGMWKTTSIFVRRTLYHMRNNIFGIVIETMLAPSIMLLIFTFLFGGAISGSAEEYIQFLLPGMLILTVIPMTVYSGTILCTDMAKGIYNRFRTMPFWQPATVFGSVLTDGLRYLIALVVVAGIGFVLGFQAQGGVLGTLAAMVYILFFSYSVSWVFAMIGNVAKRPETVSGSSMMVVYPLLFSSNVLVDASTMPKWLQIVIEINPISIAVTLTRGLFHGTAESIELIAGIGICVLLIIIFAPLTVYIYLRRQIR